MKKYPLVIGNQLNGIKCNDCGEIRYPRMDYCNKCQSSNVSEFLIGPKGKLMSYTISYIKPMIGKIKPPYPYAVARFPTEKDNYINVLGMIDSQEPFDDVKINKELNVIQDKYVVKFKMEVEG